MGPIYTLQGQVALCVLWELMARAPALGVAPYTYSSVGGALIFLQLVLGAPLMRLALWFVGEMRSDRIGRSIVLGAEGAPPVITLKLIEWEVRTGAMGSHIGDLKWVIRDTETCSVVDEMAVRRILLSAKPDVFVSMMQAPTTTATSVLSTT